jgi:hypothetical protein
MVPIAGTGEIQIAIENIPICMKFDKQNSLFD